MGKKYDFQKIEKKWQAVWRKEKIYEPDLKSQSASRRKPFYNLMMFPYPSAEGLHVGNMFPFTGSDVYGRFKRMQGYDVFEPMGLDGFGIHSENYALKIGAHPMKQAKISEKRFYKQLEMLGDGFAWDERLETYDPDYFKWTQWIFVEMFKNGLAYRKKQPVNWCPSCKTVLADEQVIAGKCERCSSIVIKKELEQWFFRITKYAERLLKNLEHIDWSERVKIAQRNWIGKSEGAEIQFPIKSEFNYVFLHGYKGSPKSNFWPWLINEVRKTGAKVYAPQLPNSAEPNIEEQVNFVLKNYSFNRNTIIVGQSLGCTVAMKLLPQLRDNIAGLVLAAPPLRTEFLDGNKRPALEKATDWKFNFKAIQKKAEWIRVIRDRKDHIVPPSHPEVIAKSLQAPLIDTIAEKTHFDGEHEPSILRELPVSIEVFTTRPDTLLGATYMVLSPEHPLIQSLESRVKNREEVKLYVKRAKAKSEEERVAEGKEKTGVELKGIKAINPANKEEIPVWAADYVLLGYGTGAIMAVPAHDERDFEFAKKYKLPIQEVILQQFGQKKNGAVFRDSVAAIFTRPKDNKILILFNRKTNEYEIPGGGRDGNDDDVTTLSREIKEEAGYTDFEVKEYLGQIATNFFAVGRNVERTKYQKAYHVFLRSERNVPLQPDAHEDYEKPHWMDPQEAIEKLDSNIHKSYESEFVKRFINQRLLCYAGNGILNNSGKFNGLDSEKAKWEITKFVGGEKKIQYRLRDWLISRQRYWGPPIPMIFCDSCAKKGAGEKKEMPGWYAVPEKDLPVKLPFLKDFRPKGKGESPLGTVKSFYETKCPKCKGKARRETDVSDTFLDSAWYFLRYPSVREKNYPWNPATTKKWLPVDMYIGGAEHSVLHLLYSRFLTMAFYDSGLLHFEEPFTKFRAHGLLIKEGAKMSKSKGNVVNPDEYIKNFGADTLRMYLMFLAPFEQGGDFRDSSMVGIERFLERVWKLMQNAKIKNQNEKSKNEKLEQLLHKTIKKVSEDIENLRYNTAVSALMILLNEFEKNKELLIDSHLQIFLKLLAPFAPHITEEIWSQTQINADKKTADKRGYIRANPRSNSRTSALRSIHLEKWPEHDPKLIEEKTFTLIIQVDGKVRDTLSAPAEISEKGAQAMALDSEKIKRFIGGKKILKIIYVPRRLVNIVTES